MGGGDGLHPDDVQELWDFDELDELEAQQSSSEAEAEPLALKSQEAGSSQASDDKAQEDAAHVAKAAAAGTAALATAAVAEGSEVAEDAVMPGGDLRAKLDFLFGPGGSDSEEDEDEEEDDDDEKEVADSDSTASHLRRAPTAKEAIVFEDPRKKLTNLEDPRLRGESLPLQEKVRQRLTRLAEARMQGRPPGPPGPPPPPPKEARAKRPPSVVAFAAEQPLVREPHTERPAGMHENVELREKGASDGKPITHEYRGMRSEGLPGVPAPVLLKRACRGAGGAGMAPGIPRPSVLALAVAEAQEATARVAAIEAEEFSLCANWGCSVESIAAYSSGQVEIVASEREQQEAEEQRRRQLEERQRLEEQRRWRLEEQRLQAEQARQEKARETRRRTAELRQQRLEEARRKAEKQRQEQEAQRYREEEEARHAQEEAFWAAREADERERCKIEAAAYEDFLLAQLQQQELLEQHKGPPRSQDGAAPAPAPAAAPPRVAAPEESRPLLQPARHAVPGAFGVYKRHQPSARERLAALGLDELRGL
uniref:Uncharacterized protein n=1 Tax=Pyrodinium bahamense TaxID=73915 RepID=A0A7S0A6T7_9DINO